MKTLTKFCLWVLLCTLVPVFSFAKLTGKQNHLLGKIYVSNVTGTVTAVVDSRIVELKKGDTLVARGTTIETAEDANATIVFSNQTGVFIDEKAKLTVKIFEQEFFTPNNNLRVEPSNSNTLVIVDRGRLVISTPRLLSGTTMVYETALASTRIRGNKVMIESGEKRTHVVMVEGNATVSPRGPDGYFVSIGKRVTNNQEAFVQYTAGGGAEDAVVDKDGKPVVQPSAAGGRTLGEAVATTGGTAAGADTPRPTEVTTAPITAETEAVVLRLTGLARVRLPAQNNESPVMEGARLPQGSTLATEEGAELYLQAYPGAIATIRPNSTVDLEKLSVTSQNGAIKKQTALLNLKLGTIISTIDPATQSINDYGIRTPKGVARHTGTSSIVTVTGSDVEIATTADTVVFTRPDGTSFSITAGMVSQTDSGGIQQPPIPLLQALGNPNSTLAQTIRLAVTTVAYVVQNNIGSLPAESANNLLSKVLAVAVAALPSEATQFTSTAITAVSSPTASTAGSVAVAVAIMTESAVSAAPAQAAQIAQAAFAAAPAQLNTIGAAAALAAPAQADQIASTLTQTLVQGSNGTVSDATRQSATELAAAIAGAVPAQSAPVAAAVMIALNQASPNSTLQEVTQTAATLAAAVTASAPDQAAPVASSIMRTLIAFAPNATGPELAASAATLASSVTMVVPPQAVEVATAVMQLLAGANTAATATPEAAAATAGLLAASVAQTAASAPGSTTNAGDLVAAIATSIAASTNIPAASIAVGAVSSVAEAANIAANATSAAAAGSEAAVTANAALANANNAAAQIAAFNGGGGSGGNLAGSGGSGSGGSATGNASGGGDTGGTGGTNTSTSIIVTDATTGAIEDVVVDLPGIEDAQGDVTFDTEGTDDPTVIPSPTPPVPSDNVTENTASSAVIPSS